MDAYLTISTGVTTRLIFLAEQADRWLSYMAQIKSPLGTRRSAADRRVEPRFPSKGLADLVVVSPPRFQRLTGAVVNISKSGFQLDLDEPIEESGRIEIRLKEFIVSGVVTNCRRQGEKGYRVGIRTVEVTEAPLRTRHFLEADVEPYLCGKGLSEAQREQYTAHLSRCLPCREKINQARRSAAPKAVARPRGVRRGL